ncbi:MAG: tetratricopeptide repeat protein [Planctomycetia bacterium]|nr:tetratricopeptide repeat protein [Planctomycetia bacterium]
MESKITWLLTALAVAVLAVLWLALGKGPRRRRCYRKAQRLLHQGDWAASLQAVEELRRLGRLSIAWDGRAKNLEGECRRQAGESALADKHYEKSLEELTASARLLQLSEADARERVLGAMLAEVRRLFAATTGSAEVRALLERIFKVQPGCAEASFWQGLCFLRDGQFDQAFSSLQAAQAAAPKFVDPPLYLGMLLLRQGKTSDALRWLAESNRLEAGCPFVGWQLGTALTAAQGDAGLAVRALQRAVLPRGFPLWLKTPDRAWSEGFADISRSYIPRLAKEHRFNCPLLGSDLAAMLRQAQLALGQAQYRLGNFQEAANLYEAVLKEAAPTHTVLRGLGLSLARLERYDEAFKHLRAAFEMEEPKDRFTAGYLALCGALGKPNRVEDKPNNVAWAIRLIGKFHEQFLTTPPRPELPEWAGLCSAIFAEARDAHITPAVEDQQACCQVLAAVAAADEAAAAAYDQLAQTQFDAVQPVQAWLYGRAAQQHGFRGQRDLDLFALTFRQRAEASAYFAERAWDFPEVEVVYLQRWAEQEPGRFPPTLGDDAPAAVEKLLLERSQRLEQAHDAEGALASVALLVRLSPEAARGYDRLACLHHRRGDLDRAAQLLAEWQGRHPQDYRPLVRLAVLQQQRGDYRGRNLALEGALGLTTGKQKARVAYLGAQLALLARTQEASTDLAQALQPSVAYPTAVRYLQTCLQEQPDHADACALLAALRWQTGDRAGLAEQAPGMRRPEVPDARFHYLAGVCQLAANNPAAQIEAAQQARASEAWGVESHFLLGLAQLERQDTYAAAASLERTALVADSPSAQHARAWLGRIAFQEGVYNDAVNWWQLLDPARRTAWQLDDVYRMTVVLSAVQAFGQQRYEQAAEQLRLAGRLGWRDRRLGPLLALSLFKEGQQRFCRAANSESVTIGNGAPRHNGAIEHEVPNPKLTPENSALVSRDGTLGTAETAEQAVSFLEGALKVGLKDAHAHYLLALAHKRLGKIDQARDALRRIQPPDANVCLQLGVLSLHEGQFAQAEEELSKSWELEPSSFAVGANLLLTRLALGRPADALPLAASVVSKAPNPDEWYRFTLLHAVLRSQATANGAPTPDPVLVQMRSEDEQRLLQLLRGCGDLETATMFLRTLRAARPHSPVFRAAHFEIQLLAAKKLLGRCEWSSAERLLRTLAADARELPKSTQGAFLNLLGCATCLCQDFRGGVEQFQTALRLLGPDLALHQNLALAHEWDGDLEKAELHWNRYFDLQERQAAGEDDRRTRVVYEGHSRLSSLYSDKEKWPQAVFHLEAAYRLRPEHVETLERLFHLYHHVRRPDQARRVLQLLQQLRPGEPQFELYELDLIEINELDDLDRWLTDIARIIARHPNDVRVEDRAAGMLNNAVTFMTRMSDQLNEQLNKVMKQVRGLDHYQINWSAVHDVMRDLKRDFQKLRRTVSRCHSMTNNTGHRQTLRDLAEHLDRKIDYCRRWQGN